MSLVCFGLDILEMGSPKIFFLADLLCHPNQSPKYIVLQGGATSARIFVVFFLSVLDLNSGPHDC
jgi:hypothetical protein